MHILHNNNYLIVRKKLRECRLIIIKFDALNHYIILLLCSFTLYFEQFISEYPGVICVHLSPTFDY